MGMVGCFIAVADADLARLKTDSRALEEYLASDDVSNRPNADVDKAWNAIHFMLTGANSESDTLEGQVVLGGRPITRDWVYGPVRHLSSTQVAAIATQLERWPADVLAGRYDPAAMDAQHVYPETWVRDGQDGLNYILQCYSDMREFYAAARDRGDGALLWLT